MEPRIKSHPRIHLDAKTLEDLKGKCGTTHAFYYGKLIEAADEVAGQKLPDAFGTGTNNRYFGDVLPVLALAYLLKGDAKYLDFSREIMNRLIACEHWGDDLDLVTGHFMSGAAITYDWLYDALPARERQAMAAKLAHHADILYRFASRERIWWHDYFLHNWNHVITGGLAYAAAALWGEHPATPAWSGYAEGLFQKVDEALPDDGSYQEGFAYMTYGWECMVRYFDLSRQLYGKEHFGGKWFREAPYLLLYFSTPKPRSQDNCMMYGDGPRHFEWHGPVHLLNRSAAEYKDEVVQGFADELAQAGIGLSRTGTWLNVLWYDPAVAKKPHTGQPTMRAFPNLDVASARSGWDSDAVMVGFKCTNNAGRKAMKECPGRDLGSGHAHPDAASFQVYAFGEWLAVDTGYTHFKQSKDHNTIMVNGVQQLGGERIWFDVMECFSNGANPELTNAEAGEDFDYFRGDATTMYRPQARLTKFVRHVIFLKPYDIVVVDELAGGKESVFQWRLHADEEIAGEGKEFVVKKNEARLKVSFLAPADMKGAAARGEVDAQGAAGLANPIVLSASPGPARETVIVTHLGAYQGAAPAGDVSRARVEGGKVTVEMMRGGKPRRITVDLAAAKVSLT